MSTYNGEKYINQQLDSIFRNERNYEIELYVRDDGSKDRTIEYLRNYGINLSSSYKINSFLQINMMI